MRFISRYFWLLIVLLLCISPFISQAQTSKAIKPFFGEIASAPYRQHSRYKGVVAHWIMVEGGGTTVRDISGFNNDGTLTNMDPASDWVLGQFGRALDFDGADDSIDAGSDSTIDDIFINGGTVTAWIMPRTVGETFGRIVDKALGESGTTGYAFLVQSAPPVLRFAKGWTGGEAGWNSPSDSIVLNQWQHVAVVYNENSTANNPALYINAVLQDETETAAPSGTPRSDAAENLILGNHSDARTFDGLIDDVRLYDRALTVQEIRSIYTKPFLEFRLELNLNLVSRSVPAPTVSWPQSASHPSSGSWGATGWGSTTW